jgi:ribonuclease R
MLIEDFMILANEAVAEFAERENLPLIYRVHEEPAERKLEGLRTLAATFGYHLPKGKVRPRDLAKLLGAMEGTAQDQLVSTVALRSMSQARYDAARGDRARFLTEREASRGSGEGLGRRDEGRVHGAAPGG